MNSISLKQITKYLGYDMPITVLSSVTSTNDYISSFSVGEVFSVIAKRQTSGRGTRGRSFVSKTGGVYLSVLIKPNLPLEKLSLITPYVSTVVAKSLETLTGKPFQIKWVNDVYFNGKKIAGILTETSITGSSLEKIVVGIGVNVGQKTFPKNLKDIATSLAINNVSIDVNRLIALILQGFIDIENKMSTPFEDYYISRSNLIGKQVTVSSGERFFYGVVSKITKSCELVVNMVDGEKTFIAGDVSVRL